MTQFLTTSQTFLKSFCSQSCYQPQPAAISEALDYNTGLREWTEEFKKLAMQKRTRTQSVIRKVTPGNDHWPQTT